MEPKKIAAGILPLCVSTGRILLLRRAHDSTYAGSWAPPGGTFDKEDLCPKVTAIREFREETGYDQKFKVSKQPWYTDDSNHIVFYTYIGLIEEEFFPKLQGEREEGLESEGFMWCYPDNLPKNMLPGAEKALKKAGNILPLVLKKYGRQ